MRIGKIIGILAVVAVCATSALALNGSGGGGSVTTNSSLTGNGTGASPLGVAPLAGFASPQYNGSNTLLCSTLNTNQIFSAFIMAAPTTWSHICMFITTADAVNKYDIGIYNAAGTLLADIGAQSFASTGSQCFPIIANASCTGVGAPSSCCTGAGAGTCPASVTSLPGIYRAVGTGNAITLAVQAQATNGLGAQWSMSANVPTTGVTANGILPSSVAALVVAPQSTTNVIPGIALY